MAALDAGRFSGGKFKRGRFATNSLDALMLGIFRPGDVGFWPGGFDPARGRIFTDVGVTPATTFGQAVGQVTRRAGTLNAVQATAGDRPILARRPKGGRRNLHPTSRPIDWNTDLITKTAGQTDPDGGTDAVKITPTAVSGIHRIHIPFTPTLSQKYTPSVWLKAAGYTLAYVNTQATLNAGVCISLSNGATTQSGPATEGVTVTAGADGWYKLTFTGTGTSTVGNNVWIQVNNSLIASDTTFTGDGTSGILVWHPQIEVGTAATAYQTVTTTGYDVTETGQPDRWALVNVSSDSLNLTVAAGTYTVAYVTPSKTVTILKGQSLSGAYSIMRATEIEDVLVINRDTTSNEDAIITAYWQEGIAA